MAQWDDLQSDFTGGEISYRMMMREDAGVNPSLGQRGIHARSLLEMENFYPTFQGTAERTPGTKYAFTTDAGNRIVPYYTPDNSYSLVEFAPSASGGPLGYLRIFRDISNTVSNGRLGGFAPTPDTNGEAWINFNPDPNIENGFESWTTDTPLYTSDGDELGARVWARGIAMNCRTGYNHSGDKDYANLRSECFVSDLSNSDPVTELSITGTLLYARNASSENGAYTLTLTIGTTLDGTDIFNQSYNDAKPGEDVLISTTVDGLSLAHDTKLYMRVALTALDTEGPSVPLWLVDFWGVASKQEVSLGNFELHGVVPYLADEIGDVHVVQSPYPNLTPGSDGGKELVFTHPNHPPYELISTAPNTYTFAPKPFTVDGTAGTPWDTDNYPATCTSFNGRLILGGSRQTHITNTSQVNPSETVWGTEVGNWSAFSADDAVNPDDSIKLNTIYRSPIQWVYGHKTLMIGAAEMEYNASADGIFKPSDIGVELNSTHGSVPVQPVALGDAILFAAESGTKVRAMSYSDQDGGWVAPDMTFYAATITQSGVKRMVRMRNPHQMVIVLTNNGQLGMFHMDKNVGVTAWSRINLNASIQDITVVPNDKGEDVLYLSVQRYINGATVHYVECIPNWVEGRRQPYMQSAVAQGYIPQTSSIFNLGTLEGMTVQVTGDNNFLGSYVVTGAKIDLVDQVGNPIYVTNCTVGLAMPATLRTMPIVTQDPKSSKRYTGLSVRTIGLGASVPMINGERAAERRPLTRMNTTQGTYIVRDSEVTSLGASTAPIVTVSENLPIPLEIAGIFGKVTGNST